MAKNMARIKDGIVVNIEWHSNKHKNTNTLIDIGDCPVAIGDTYSNGTFYREGAKVLTSLEYDLDLLSEYGSALREIEKVLGANEPSGNTVDSRKQAILSRINDINSALALMEVTPVE